jgi:3-hydroxy-3-methylglutaryl CoA synthase
VPSPEALLDLSYDASVTDKNVEKTFVGLAKAAFDKQVEPSMHCARRCGNMYTASLYGGLASLVSAVEPAALKGKRISMFAYGSGCASSFYTLHVKGDTTEIRTKLDLLPRLASMKVVPCQEYVDSLKVRFLSPLARTPAHTARSSARRTTTRPRTHPRARSTTSGLARGTWRRSTPSTAANTLAFRLREG